MLTAEQVNHFNTFGFLVLRQLFTADEAAIMKREAEEIMSDARGGQPADPTVWQAVQPFFERRPFLSQLVDDDRVYSIGQDILGPDFFLDGTEGNLHTGDTAWHGDGSGEVIRQTKIVFYVDPLTRDTGCLRVIPGTHLAVDPDPFAILRSGNKDPDFRPFGMHPSEMPSVAVETQPGDVVVFTEHTLHAAFGGKPGRHQHAVSFFACPQTPEQMTHLQNLYAKFRFSLHPAESYVNSDRPRIRRLVSLLVEQGFETSKC